MKLGTFLLMGWIALGTLLPAQAEDWKFPFGTYTHVVVTKVDSKCVSFTCDQGNLVMLLSVLPPDIKASLATKPIAAPKAPPVLPKTLTTIYGTTYTDCVLDKVTPDGISFVHSSGAAKVPFSDLDPALAAQFGYSPDAAQKYSAAERARQAQIDVDNAALLARQKAQANLPPPTVAAAPTAAAPPAPAPAAAPVVSASPPSITASPATAPQGKPAVDKSAIQAKIDALKAQIKKLQAMAKNQDQTDKAKYDAQHGTYSGYYYSNGAYGGGYAYAGGTDEHDATMSRKYDENYDEQIRDLQRQIDELTVQL